MGANQTDKTYPTTVFVIGVSASLVQLHDVANYYFSSRTTTCVYVPSKIGNSPNAGTFASSGELQSELTTTI
jgi:hypothetical protein